MNGTVVPSTNQSVHGVDDVWPSISVIQLSPVSVPGMLCDGSMATGGAFTTNLQSAYIIDSVNNGDSMKLKLNSAVDECCQTKISWLGDSIKYIIDDTILYSKPACASNMEIEPIVILVRP